MVRRSVRALGIAALCLAAVSCQRLNSGMCPKPAPGAAKAAARVALPSSVAGEIPEEYGPCIGVTQDPARPGEVALWFQKPDRSIVAVFVDVGEGRLSDRVLTLARGRPAAAPAGR